MHAYWFGLFMKILVDLAVNGEAEDVQNKIQKEQTDDQTLLDTSTTDNPDQKVETGAIGSKIEKLE